MNKPDKPRPDFPLFPHDRGKWAKKIDGNMKYFGRWEDPEGALREYLEWMRAKETPTLPNSDGLSLKNAFNVYLTQRKKDMDAKKIAVRTFTDYKRTLSNFAKFFGSNRTIQSLSVLDFTSYQNDFASKNNPVACGNEATRIKSAFKWLKQAKLIEEVDFGQDFKKPSRKVARRYRRARGEMLFTARDIHSILNECGIKMRAAVLLGINCAFQNDDIERLPLKIAKAAIAKGVMELPREKTEIERGCPLWPETTAALESWLAIRPESKNPQCFLRFDGEPLTAGNAEVAKYFRAIREMAGVKGGGFSWLRKTFATYASECADQIAVDAIMGHVDDSIPGQYRQLLRENRLHKATDTVHAWLYGAASPCTPDPKQSIDPYDATVEKQRHYVGKTQA